MPSHETDPKVKREKIKRKKKEESDVPIPTAEEILMELRKQYRESGHGPIIGFNDGADSGPIYADEEEDQIQF
jgi:hypothetical protein